MVDIDLIRRALAEDLAGGTDITSVATVSGNENVVADFTARKSGVVAGIEMAIATLREVGLTDISQHLKDGDRVEPGTVLLTVRGDTRAILLAERTALNFLSHLGGIATLTNRWVQEVAGTKTLIRDTRKTIAAAGGVVQAFSKVRSAFPDAFVEIEVDSISQLEEVAAQSPDLVLLDNMSPQECARAVALVAGRFKLEASGGITLENAQAYAESGVDYLAIGALTHSAPVLDIGLDLRLETRTEK
jgi:nicotinate-nucleotide pyrophosphorylase (carboxylating)